LALLGDERAVPVLQKALNAGPQTTKAGKEYLIAHEAARTLRSWGVQSEDNGGEYRIVDVPADAERVAPEAGFELSVARILQRLCAAVEKAYADAGLTKEDVQGLVAVQATPQKLIGKWKAYKETWPVIVKARAAAIQEMASLGPGAIPILLKAIDKTDERRAGDIFVLAITKVGKPGVDALIDGLSHKDAGVRARAAASLGEIRDTHAVEPLVGTLSDPNVMVLNAAVRSLGLLADQRAVEPLLDLWNRQDKITRTELAWALGLIRDRRAAKPIMAALEESVSFAQKTGNWDMNSWALRVYAGALGQIGDPQAIPLLKKMLNAGPQRTKGTPKYLVAEAAAEALRLLGLEVTGDAEQGGYQVIEVFPPDKIQGNIKQD